MTNEYSEVSDISFKEDSISAKFYAKTNDYLTIRKHTMKDKNSMQSKWKHISGNNGIINYFRCNK